MKRRVILVLCTLICFILQSTVFKALSIGSITPNLILIAVVSVAFMQGQKEGLLLGFFAGLLVDIFYGSLLGLYALIYMYVGFISGFFCKIFIDEDIKVPLILVAGFDVCYGVLVYVIHFMMRGRVAFSSYLFQIILPEMVYTVLVTIILYRIFYRINHVLVQKEMKGKQSIWLRS